MLKHIDNNFEDEVLKAEKVVLVDFFATWCGPCQMLGPVLEQIAKEQDNFDIAKVDIDENQELAINYGIQVVPTMVVFKNGQVVDSMEGFYSKSEILSKVSKYLN